MQFVDSVAFGSTLSTFRTHMVQFVNRTAAGPTLSTFRTPSGRASGANHWPQRDATSARPATDRRAPTAAP